MIDSPSLRFFDGSARSIQWISGICTQFARVIVNRCSSTQSVSHSVPSIITHEGVSHVRLLARPTTEAVTSDTIHFVNGGIH